MKKKKRFSFPLWNAYFSIKEQLILSLLVLFGVVLRIGNAIYTPFWRDEIYIFYVARTNTLWQLITQQHWDTAHPPLYSLFLHVWQMFSVHPLWQRVPSIITSFFILFFIPILAVRITTKYRLLPFVFLFLFAISHAQISLNMVARPYPFVILLSILSLTYILELHNKKTLSFKNTYTFLLVNALGFYIDYSFVWLFFTYLFTLAIQFFKAPRKRNVIIILTQSLIVTGVVLIPAFILLFVNLPQSLKLEAQSGIKFKSAQHTNIPQGEILTVSLSKKGTPQLTVQSSRTYANKHVPMAVPMFTGTQHLGFDIPPLSGIVVNKLAYCASKTTECTTYRDYLSQLKGSGLKAIITQEVGSSLLLFNMHPQEWRSFLFPISNENSVAVQSIQTSFAVIGYHPSAQILLVSAKENSINYLDPTKTYAKFMIESRNFHYEARFRDFQNNLQAQFLKSTTFLDTFKIDLLLFSGLPSHTNDIYALISLPLLFFSIVMLCSLIKDRSTFSPTLFVLLFLTPLLVSFCISVFLAPIFVARNLYATSLAYILGISLLAVWLLMKTGLKRVFGVMFLLFFIYVLFSKYPFLHYVDPPYGVDKMIHTIVNSDKQKKKIVIIDNASHYKPLLHHQLLMVKKPRVPIAIITLDSFRQILNHLRIDDTRKKQYEYYFIRFNQSINNFGDIQSILGCKIDQTKVPYAFFAHCYY